MRGLRGFEVWCLLFDVCRLVLRTVDGVDKVDRVYTLSRIYVESVDFWSLNSYIKNLA